MAVFLSPVGGVAAQFFDNSGNVLTGGKIYSYAAGTTTPQVTYTSAAGATFHSNPIILDAAGRVPSGEIWLADGLSYKFVIKDANEVLIGTYDNIIGINSNFLNYAIQEEIQTATAGQTVFTLGTMTYSPGTNTLQVFVDGVNQYDGITYAYVETNSTTVTFTAGLLVGALVKFTTAISNSSGVTSASLVTFTGFNGQTGVVQDLADDDGSDWIGFLQSGTGAVARSAQEKMQDVVSVKDFGAVGDGVTDDTIAIQAAIDSLAITGGALYFPFGEYKIARTIGTNDHWGLKITGSNVTLIGDGASLSRYNADISTYALAYPLLFIGTPDSNVAAQTQNVKVIGLNFIGNNTQHSISGASPNDFRCAIYLKNTNGATIENCNFTEIDSSSIYYQAPVSYDYVNSTYYNTTKNYNSAITKCQFLATSHVVVDRALIHAIEATGLDYLNLENNYFSWCDSCFSAETTYNLASNIETNTYLPTVAGWSLGAVKRSGRGHNVVGNTMINSSENCIYAASIDVVIGNNYCRIEDATICAGTIKNRAKNSAITGNTVIARINCIVIAEPAINVTVTGNTASPIAEGAGGAISIQAVTLVAYIAARIDYLTYIPMQNFVISGNTVNFPAATAADFLDAIAFRLYAPTALNAFFPNGMLLSTTISNNNVTNHAIGVYLIGSLINIRYVNVTGNTLYGKSYAGAFSAVAVLNTYAAIAARFSDTEVMSAVNFTNNTVIVSRYIVATNTGGGTNVYGPNQIQSNQLTYIQNYGSTDMRAPANDLTMFCNNSGSYFIDRTGWVGAASLNNALGDLTNTANSYRKYRVQYNGTNVLFYTDDSATAITLG